MSEIQQKRYYWLKLKDDFFNSEDMKLILAQKNGEKYVIFWQKLLLKAITSKEVGVLRYKDSIPYTPDMFSTILDTDIDIVKSALDLFVKLGMIGILPDGSFWLEEAQKMVGSETIGAIQKRELRADKQIKITNNDDGRQCLPLSSDCLQEIDIEKDKEIDIDKQKKQSSSKPTDPFAIAGKCVKDGIITEQYKNVAGTFLKVHNITEAGKCVNICKSIKTIIDDYNKLTTFETRIATPAIVQFALNWYMRTMGKIPTDPYNHTGWYKDWDKVAYRAFPSEYVNLETSERVPLAAPAKNWLEWCETCLRMTYVK